MTRTLPPEWCPDGDPFTIENEPGVTADSVLYLAGLVCLLVLIYGGELLLAWR